MVIEMSEKLRHELKYLCRKSDLQLLEQRIRHIMQYDPHADSRGEYQIRSVYFDSYSRKCYYENENGIDPREKYRIRIYNLSSDRIVLEKKKKIRGMTGKESCLLDYDLCMKMLRGEQLLEYLGRNQLLDEWILERNTKLLKPVMLGEYLRKVFVYPLGNVRVTFDQNITASYSFKDLFSDQLSRVSVLPTGCHILEVKYTEYLPDVLYQTIENGHFRQNTFSKFYLGCKALEGSFINVI